MTRSLVTGGAGFIGSHLVDALVARGDHVVVLDDLSTGTRKNLGAVEQDIEFIHGDIRDEKTLRRAVSGADLVFHLAAVSSVPRSVHEPVLTHDVNAAGTLKLLQAAREAGARRLVYSSSAAVYGTPASLPLTEDSPTHPESPYAIGKLVGELWCRMYSRLYGLSTVSLRYFNVFGPRQNADSPYAGVVSTFLAALRAGTPARIYGSGEQTRDFISVSSVVASNLQAGEVSGNDGDVFNIGAGEPTTILALIDLLEGATRRQLIKAWAPERPGDIQDSWSSITRARRALRFVPHPLREELAAFIDSQGPGSEATGRRR